VRVNSAPAEELAAVLGIELRVAQAIVTYRGSNGRFKDGEDLAKVPGLTREILVAQTAALQFEDTAGLGRRRMTPVHSFRLKKQVVR
jgi:competence ComEA-like helix-hairpin-helix protein